MKLEDMTPEQRAQMQLWVDTWKKAGPELERMREEEVSKQDTIANFETFTGMALLCIRDRPPEPTSGLVEQQRWFRILAEKQKLASEEPNQDRPSLETPNE